MNITFCTRSLFAFTMMICLLQGEPSLQPPYSDKPYEFLIGEVPDDLFQSVTLETIPKRVISRSRNFSEFILASKYQPYNANDLQLSWFLGDKGNELLELKWSVDKIQFRSVESANGLKLYVVFDKSELFKDAVELNTFLVELIRMEGSPDYSPNKVGDFVFPKTLQAGSFFSSNPKQDICFMFAWCDRIDGKIIENGFILYFYKKSAQRPGFPIDEKWITKALEEKNKALQEAAVVNAIVLQGNQILDQLKKTEGFIVENEVVTDAPENQEPKNKVEYKNFELKGLGTVSVRYVGSKPSFFQMNIDDNSQIHASIDSKASHFGQITLIKNLNSDSAYGYWIQFNDKNRLSLATQIQGTNFINYTILFDESGNLSKWNFFDKKPIKFNFHNTKK